MNYPEPLHEGDTVGLIAPCSPVTKHALESSIETIRSMGYHVVTGESTSCSLHGYLAGTDAIRANDINSMFLDSSIHAIFCLRGGYGSNRIMDLIDYEAIRKNPKIFVGYSDITTFHLAFHALSDLVTFHGPMVCANMNSDFDSYTRRNFFAATSAPKCLTFHNPEDTPAKVIVEGRGKGRILGGCLSLVSPAIGTFYSPDFTDKILFLEDVDESLPRCDKLMCHLRNSGIFDRVAGVVLGNFRDCENYKDDTYEMEDFFRDFFYHYDKPVLYNIQSGHQKPIGTIPFGTMCTLNTERKELSFDYI